MNKLTLPIFFEFVEIRTKLASQIPLAIGLLWALKRYGSLNGWNTLLFFIAVFLFDMATTAINNTVDYYKAIDLDYKQQENVIGKYGLPLHRMVWLTLGLLVGSVCVSLVLVPRVDMMLLLFGSVCMLIGVCYTFGPFPLSRLPLGEVFSGVTMGFGIFFLAVYVNHPEHLVMSFLDHQTFVLTMHWVHVMEIFLHSIPFICLIANIMLANNICDLEQDVGNERYTLVYYIGKKYSLLLFNVLATIPWLMWLLWIGVGFYPLWTLGALVGIVPYVTAIRRFNRVQSKAETFSVSLIAFIIYSGGWAFVLIVQLLFR